MKPGGNNADAAAAAKKPGKAKGTRRQGRTVAFQALFGLSFTPETDAAGLRRIFSQNPAVEDCSSPEALHFASELFMGAAQRLPEIDAVISQHSNHWKLGRIAKIELTILRLALFEILDRPDIPLKVAINEAVELAKTFGDESSRAFVNGILDAVARAVDEGRFGIDKRMDRGAADKRPADAAGAHSEGEA